MRFIVADGRGVISFVRMTNCLESEIARHCLCWSLVDRMVKSCGSVLAGTPIAVDFWSTRHCPPSVHFFFLTHMHTDHIVGLTPSWNRPIYCTPVTKKLLLHKFQVPVVKLHIFDVSDIK